jgi:hypothetical protein
VIRVQLSQEKVRNGDSLTGRVMWTASGKKQPRKIEAICRWRIEGKGRRKETIVDQELGLDVESRSEVSVQFDFTIPLYGPLSYDGKLFRVIWEVVGRADLPFAIDEVEVKEFAVVARPWNAEEWKEEEEEEEEEHEEEDTEEVRSSKFEVRMKKDPG